MQSVLWSFLFRWMWKRSLLLNRFIWYCSIINMSSWHISMLVIDMKKIFTKIRIFSNTFLNFFNFYKILTSLMQLTIVYLLIFSHGIWCVNNKWSCYYSTDKQNTFVIDHKIQTELTFWRMHFVAPWCLPPI